MAKDFGSIRPCGGEEGKYHMFYTGPGYNTTRDDVLAYGEKVGMNKVYWASDSSNYTAFYNGDTFVLYGDKENLPEDMRKDAEHAEMIERVSKEAENRHMVISADESQFNFENKTVGLPIMRDGVVVTAIVKLDNASVAAKGNGQYDIDFGTRAVRHEVQKPGDDFSEVPAERLKNMVDYTREHAAQQEHDRQMDEFEMCSDFGITEDDLPF